MARSKFLIASSRSPSPVQRLAEQIVHTRLRRPVGDGAAGELDALLVLALLAGDHGDVIERVGVLRVALQHLDVALHGLRQIALAVVEQALLEQLRGGGGFGHERRSKQGSAAVPSGNDGGEGVMVCLLLGRPVEMR